MSQAQSELVLGLVAVSRRWLGVHQPYSSFERFLTVSSFSLKPHAEHFNQLLRLCAGAVCVHPSVRPVDVAEEEAAVHHL